MNLLINCTNLSGGGGIQVANSILRLLHLFPEHRFIAVGSKAMAPTLEAIKNYENVETIEYSYPSSNWKSLITGRNIYLDSLVENNAIDCVLTVFGPMKWRPRCQHLCGFALAHVILNDSPFWKKLKLTDRVKWKIRAYLWRIIFRRSSHNFYTENEYISTKLQSLMRNSQVYTVTNYYNQVFDNPEEQKIFQLPPCQDGCFRLLDIASSGLHKNQELSLEICKILRNDHPDFKFQFVFTLTPSQFPEVPDEFKENFVFIGAVPNEVCPSLYEQTDASFQPTLLECFTATYVEAMRMKKPIITTDLEFAKGICKDAAAYYSATSAQSAADVIYQVASNPSLQSKLIDNGVRRLSAFDNQTVRAEKLIKICEKITSKQ